MPKMTLQGVLPVFQTPYHADESIDFGVLAGEIDWLFERGVDGVTMAMVSEVLRLSHAERMEVAAAVCRRAGGRGPVVVSVGAESSHVAEELARHAESVGAAAVMATPPLATAPGEAELLRYYERLIRAVACPVVVQDASGYLGTPLAISSMVQLHREFGDRVMFKPEGKSAGQQLASLAEATGGRAALFAGGGGAALAEHFRIGLAGVICGADLVTGIVALWRALREADHARAVRIASRVSAIVSHARSLDDFLQIEKHLLVRQGVFTNTLVRGTACGEPARPELAEGVEPVAPRLADGVMSKIDRLFDELLDEVKR